MQFHFNSKKANERTSETEDVNVDGYFVNWKIGILHNRQFYFIPMKFRLPIIQCKWVEYTNNAFTSQSACQRARHLFGSNAHICLERITLQHSHTHSISGCRKCLQLRRNHPLMTLEQFSMPYNFHIHTQAQAIRQAYRHIYTHTSEHAYIIHTKIQNSSTHTSIFFHSEARTLTTVVGIF